MGLSALCLTYQVGIIYGSQEPRLEYSNQCTALLCIQVYESLRRPLKGRKMIDARPRAQSARQERLVTFGQAQGRWRLAWARPAAALGNKRNGRCNPYNPWLFEETPRPSSKANLVKSFGPSDADCQRRQGLQRASGIGTQLYCMYCPYILAVVRALESGGRNRQSIARSRAEVPILPYCSVTVLFLFCPSWNAPHAVTLCKGRLHITTYHRYRVTTVDNVERKIQGERGIWRVFALD